MSGDLGGDLSGDLDDDCDRRARCLRRVGAVYVYFGTVTPSRALNGAAPMRGSPSSAPMR